MATAITRAIGFQYVPMAIASTRAKRKTIGFRIKVDFDFSRAISRRDSLKYFTLRINIKQ